MGVGAGQRVGVCLSREPYLPVGLLAVLATGAAYVPLDPNWPASRLNLVWEEAGLSLILVDEKTAALWEGEPTLDIEGPAPKSQVRPANVFPESPAYLIFTSGSTGKPKGVTLCHRNLAEFAAWGGRTFSEAQLAGVFAGTSATFDVSVCELLLPLANGGTIIMGENALDLIDHPRRDRVRMFNTVPSAMVALVAQQAIPGGVQRVNLAGEALPAPLLRDILTQTHLQVVNLYGPTEDTVYATMAVLNEAGEEDPVIGLPLSGKDAWVMDRQMRLQPLGVPGELYLGGHGLATGYWRKPDLTAQRFVPHPFGKEAGERLYRTGDLVRRDATGAIHFIGRIDHQVKVNGYRIEPGEVSHYLRSLPDVREAEAVARQISGHMRLIGYVCLNQPHTEPRILTVSRHPCASNCRGTWCPSC